MNVRRTYLASTERRHAQRISLLLAGVGLAAVGLVRAQTQIPITIARDDSGPAGPLILSWPAIPGRIYEIWMRDGLESPWITTNLAAVQARSTRASTNQPVGADAVPVRFYEVRARAVAPGNTGPITSNTVVELEKTLGLTFTPAQRTQLRDVLSNNRSTFESMRRTRLVNSDRLPLLFDPLPDGFEPSMVQSNITWSAPKHASVPANRDELAFYSVRDLGELLRTRQITSTELTRLFLDRLKKHDPVLHCVITLTEELALEQAARADEELNAGRYRGPLHGVPYGIKDLFAVAGYRTTWGAAPFQDQVIDEDATVVKKLEEAGAVLVAKLSTGELALNDLWFGGRTRNPWNVDQGSSGSSAGPASATAAGLVPFAIGTETWGSIVAPSTVCRVTGLRTTFGRVSRTGAMNLSWTMDKIGPICRDVEDCAIVFDIIRGSDGVDHAVSDLPFNFAPGASLTGLRVGYGNLSATVLNRLAAIVGQDHLMKVTLPARLVDPLLILRAEAAAVFDELMRFGGDAFLLPQSGWPPIFREGRTIPAVEYLQGNRLRQKLVESMAALMRQIDVYVGTDAEIVSGAGSDISNLTGQPCVVIPHGGSTSLGFIGRPFEEDTILVLAKAYQDATPYHTNRPPAFLK